MRHTSRPNWMLLNVSQCLCSLKWLHLAAISAVQVIASDCVNCLSNGPRTRKHVLPSSRAEDEPYISRSLKRLLRANDSKEAPSPPPPCKDAVVICTLGTGTPFGESILDNTPRHATIVTRECTELLRIEQREFRALWEVSLQTRRRDEKLENNVQYRRKVWTRSNPMSFPSLLIFPHCRWILKI